MELAQLLQRWAELEPKRCNPTPLGSAYLLQIGKKHEYFRLAQIDWNGLALLEYAVRDAIIARGWDWKIESVTTGFYATVLRTAYDSVGIYEQQPAIALLIAYIEGLEATR